MRPRKTEAEKKKPGPKPYRTYYTAIGFYISKNIYENIKELAYRRRVRIEDIYAEATELLLYRREAEPILYLAAPLQGRAAQIHVKMHDDLRARARQAAQEDGYRLNDFFETASRIYLKEHNVT